MFENRAALGEGARCPLPGLRIETGTLGTREELVPGTEQGPLAIYSDRVVDGGGGQGATGVGHHCRIKLRVGGDGDQFLGGCGRHQGLVRRGDDCCSMGVIGVLRIGEGVCGEILAFQADQFDVDSGIQLHLGVVYPGVPVVGPGLNVELPVTQLLQPHPGLPDVQALGPDLNHVDVVGGPLRIRQHDRRPDSVMPFAVDPCGDWERFPLDCFCRIGAMLNDRGNLADRESAELELAVASAHAGGGVSHGSNATGNRAQIHPGS